MISFVMMSCTKKNQTEEIIEETISIPKIEVDNFLKGNLYYYSSFYDESGVLQTSLVFTKDGKYSNEGFISRYGTFMHFSDSCHYRQFNTAPCGNDCFFTTYGRYELQTDDDITFEMDSTVYSGMCGNEGTVYGKGEKKNWKIVRTRGDSIIQLINK